MNNFKFDTVNAPFKFRSVGRCLIEATHANFDELIKSCTKFVVYSQFDPEQRIGRLLKEPICGSAEILYGIDANGTQVKLKYIIDTSD